MKVQPLPPNPFIRAQFTEDQISFIARYAKHLSENPDLSQFNFDESSSAGRLVRIYLTPNREEVVVWISFETYIEIGDELDYISEVELTGAALDEFLSPSVPVIASEGENARRRDKVKADKARLEEALDVEGPYYPRLHFARDGKMCLSFSSYDVEEIIEAYRTLYPNDREPES